MIPKGSCSRQYGSIKAAYPGMVVITDVCACEYTSHGHCGIVGGNRCGGKDLLNDESLLLMNRIAASHAEAGADIVAPSCMLDGMVRSIRMALDDDGYEDVLIMSYSTKFSSALYGPFREAAESGYSFGDRTTYQMNPANGREAFLESKLDMEEGADILMVKPAGPYLDVLAEIATLGLPVAAYQVSGEYAMIKAAAERGWIDEKATVLEIPHLHQAGGGRPHHHLFCLRCLRVAEMKSGDLFASTNPDARRRLKPGPGNKTLSVLYGARGRCAYHHR